ncbi:CFEM domain protein [Metarhizium robertsii]|uniref:Extracellular membrane protein, CFEM domain protein n=2 Tax=Metarhizium robertsii TaxID=568076 RepID=E9F7J8_METRA|nr:Extracellular membrane protein, CFEM domain protein [Metarhizium robertsii ARSEF 23]EFY96335.1 Extracellular membrane protein, CFEM domain protein [Metarhizium robertsii ARSEF 23]EXU98616.1 CFEM domain protein [Metarhizium robertsii]
MGRLLPLFLGVLSTLHILGVSAQTAPACVETCTNEVRNKFADLKCSDANAAPCFCTNPTFSAAILECSKPQCQATADNVFTYLTSHFCVGQPLPKPDNTAAPSSEASQTPTPSAHATTSTSAVPEPSSSAISSSTTATPAATTSMSTESTPTSATVETTGTPTKSSSPSSTSDSAPSATSSSAATEGSSSKGLSQAAIAGIGVGIGAAVIAIAGIVICMLLKARRRKPGRNGHNRDISKPLPGPDRMYAHRNTSFRRNRDHSMEKFGNDLEMTSHRYEDMVPRTQPRTLV